LRSRGSLSSGRERLIRRAPAAAHEQMPHRVRGIASRQVHRPTQGHQARGLRPAPRQDPTDDPREGEHAKDADEQPHRRAAPNRMNPHRAPPAGELRRGAEARAIGGDESFIAGADHQRPKPANDFSGRRSSATRASAHSPDPHRQSQVPRSRFRELFGELVGRSGAVVVSNPGKPR